MSYAIDPPPQASVAVVGTDARFPVRRIFCVGRNYAEHAREMGNDPDREPPFFFTKPADAVIDAPCTVAYPPLTNELHHEVELVVAIGKGGADIAEADVMSHVWGAAAGLDMTRRDLQAEAKKAGRPWDWAKGFDQSAPMSPVLPIANVASLEQGRIWLSVNGALRQEGDLSDMIWAVREHIATLSRAVTLVAGDLVMTGTPAGVGAVAPGDVIECGVDGVGEMQVTIGPRHGTA